MVGYWGRARCVTRVRLSLLDLSPFLVGGATALCPASLQGPSPEVILVVLFLTFCCLGCRFLGVHWSRDVAVSLCSCCSTTMEGSESVWGARSMMELTRYAGCGCCRGLTLPTGGARSRVASALLGSAGPGAWGPLDLPWLVPVALPGGNSSTELPHSTTRSFSAPRMALSAAVLLSQTASSSLNCWIKVSHALRLASSAVMLAAWAASLFWSCWI